MIVLSGASASGKTEVAKLLASKYGIVKVITTTTRKARAGETDGRDYFFVTKEKFEEMISADLFVEHTVYNGNYYGSTKDQVRDDKAVVIDSAGIRSYLALNDPHIVTFFLHSDEETRFKRMLTRGDTREDAEKRIKNDRVAFDKSHVAKVDFEINNSDITLEELAEDIYRKYMEVIRKRG